MAEQDRLALYRLWRPQTFSEMVAQEQVVYPLRQSVISETFSHALLFSGHAGQVRRLLPKFLPKPSTALIPTMGIRATNVRYAKPPMTVR